jgi:putative toxin-antitoxin system antitoxin component (TIGR02293 family)
MAQKPLTNAQRTNQDIAGLDRYRLKLGASIDSLRRDISAGNVTGARVRTLRQGLELTLGDVAHVLGTSERSVMRKEQSKARLTVAEGDRAYRLARVADLATELIGDADRARRWLKTPHRYLGNETPIALLDTEIGTDLVIESLYAIAYGGIG